MIQKIWSTPGHLPHVSVRAAAKIFGLSEATLRRELKRSYAEGKYRMRLNDEAEIKWQYFPYYADKAIQNARKKSSHTGAKMNLMSTYINMTKEYVAT